MHHATAATQANNLFRRTATGKIGWVDYPSTVAFASDKIWYQAWQLNTAVQVTHATGTHTIHCAPAASHRATKLRNE